MLRSFTRMADSAMSLEVASISRMGSASLRETVDAMQLNNSISQAEKRSVLDAVSARVQAIQPDIKYWDLVSIVQAHASVFPVDNERLETLGEMLRGKLSHLSPKHLVDVLAAYEAAQLRPKSLYKAIGHRVIDLVRGPIYADELVALLRVLARFGVNDSGLLDAITQGLLVNDSLSSQLRILHCCEILGGFAHVNHLDVRLGKKLQEKVSRELQVVPLEELWKTVTAFEQLCFSYTPVEDRTRARLGEIVSSLQPVHFDQVSSPMEFFQFLRLNDWLSESVLLTACKWANDAVYRPATRTQAHRRPNIFEVALLADLCREMDVPMDRIEKAVRITVTSKGGTVERIAKPKPLRYRRRRAYLRERDGYAALNVEPAKLFKRDLNEKKDNKAAFAPSLRAQTDEALWKSRSGPWFLRK